MAVYKCIQCGNILLETGNGAYCPSCGATYKLNASLDAKSALTWLFIGTFIVGPFIWAPLGRRMAIESITRGADVTSKKVEKWIEKGEKKRREVKEV